MDATLQEQIELKSKEIHTDSYSMSIGEIISMYKEGDIDIHPEFQRFFRWTSSQKTKLIESVLLNIPIPSIFVSQRKDGVWDVVDGLQRISTLLQFVGILKNEKGKYEEPLILETTELLPALKGKTFGNDDSEETDNTLSDVQRRYFKRVKLNMVIIQKESDEDSKYDLFQRLNTGGTALNDQEIRSCLMVMTNPELYRRIKELTDYLSFVQTTGLSDKNIEEQYNLELVIRFICLRKLAVEEIRGVPDLGDYLNHQIVKIMKDPNFNWDIEFSILKQTFDKLNLSLKEKSFIRYSPEGLCSGGFLVAAYEIIALGIGYDPNNVQTEEIENKTRLVWGTITQESISWKGYNASGRLLKTLKLGRRIFQNESI
ncbi:hypothetical protein EZS27_025632 [termite gut metagenome]|uniref:GmrSD restriction endonucleases N-terminal domain-containing protein n=1 Tax=termite gut metagenome TaxID=433724 RepID=A0A5J4QVB1_9ZZZZ